MNQVFLNGYLTADFTVRNSKKDRTEFLVNKLAVNGSRDTVTNRIDYTEAEFYDLVVFSQKVIQKAKCFSKGIPVLVIGEVTREHYVTNTGEKRYTKKITVSEIIPYVDSVELTQVVCTSIKTYQSQKRAGTFRSVTTTQVQTQAVRQTINSNDNFVSDEYNANRYNHANNHFNTQFCGNNQFTQNSLNNQFTGNNQANNQFGAGNFNNQFTANNNQYFGNNQPFGNNQFGNSNYANTSNSFNDQPTFGSMNQGFGQQNNVNNGYNGFGSNQNNSFNTGFNDSDFDDEFSLKDFPKLEDIVFDDDDATEYEVHTNSNPYQSNNFNSSSANFTGQNEQFTNHATNNVSNANFGMNSNFGYDNNRNDFGNNQVNTNTNSFNSNNKVSLQDFSRQFRDFATSDNSDYHNNVNSGGYSNNNQNFNNNQYYDSNQFNNSSFGNNSFNNQNNSFNQACPNMSFNTLNNSDFNLNSRDDNYW